MSDEIITGKNLLKYVTKSQSQVITFDLSTFLSHFVAV